MKSVLNIIVLFLAIAAVFYAAGCVEKTQITGNNIRGVSEQVTPVTATTAPIPVTPSVAIPLRSVATTATPTPSVTIASMKGMDSTSSSSLDPASTVKDVVCKMKIDKRTAEFKSEYKGKTYYFCSANCKTKFDKNPEKYTS
jgi:YHS domain-containing protein